MLVVVEGTQSCLSEYVWNLSSVWRVEIRILCESCDSSVSSSNSSNCVFLNQGAGKLQESCQLDRGWTDLDQALNVMFQPSSPGLQHLGGRVSDTFWRKLSRGIIFAALFV